MLTRRQLLAAGASVLPTAVIAKGASYEPVALKEAGTLSDARSDYIRRLKNKEVWLCDTIPESHRHRYDLFFRVFNHLDEADRKRYESRITSFPPHSEKDVAIATRVDGKFAEVRIIALWDNTAQEFIAVPVTREQYDDVMFCGEDESGKPRWVNVYATEARDPSHIVNWSALPV